MSEVNPPVMIATVLTMVLIVTPHGDKLELLYRLVL